MSTKEERNKSMTFQKAPIKQMKLEQKTCVSKKITKNLCQNLMTTKFESPSVFFSTRKISKEKKQNPPGCLVQKFPEKPERTSTQVVVPVASHSPRRPPSNSSESIAPPGTTSPFESWSPWEPTTFIFRGYNPYIGGSKPSFCMVLGSKGS